MMARATMAAAAALCIGLAACSAPRADRPARIACADSTKPVFVMDSVSPLPGSRAGFNSTFRATIHYCFPHKDPGDWRTFISLEGSEERTLEKAQYTAYAVPLHYPSGVLHLEQSFAVNPSEPQTRHPYIVQVVLFPAKKELRAPRVMFLGPYVYPFLGTDLAGFYLPDDSAPTWTSGIAALKLYTLPSSDTTKPALLTGFIRTSPPGVDAHTQDFHDADKPGIIDRHLLDIRTQDSAVAFRTETLDDISFAFAGVFHFVGRFPDGSLRAEVLDGTLRMARAGQVVGEGRVRFRYAIGY